MFHICGITIEGTVRNGEGQHVGFTTEARLKKASTARLQVDIGKSLAWPQKSARLKEIME